MSADPQRRGNGRTHPARMGAKTSPYWSDLSREHGFEPLEIEGDLPRDLCGTLYRAGPALSQRFGRPYGHVFEGDGAICAVRLAEGEAKGAHRLVRSEGFVREERAGRPLYQSAVSWPRQLANNLLGRWKNTANTNVMEWHGGLYALMENARPTAIDSELETIGETTFGGVIRSAFSAHPHAVVERRTTYNFGLRYGRRTTLVAYALPWEGGARCLTELPLDHPVMLHDFMATRDHLVFLVSPFRLVMVRAALAIGDFSDLFRWTPTEGTEVIVVPIDAPERVRRFRVDPFFQIHFAAGYEEPDAVAVDIMAYPDSSALERNVVEIDRPPECGVVTRVHIPHDRDEIRKEVLCDAAMEFGQIDRRRAGLRHRHLWGLNASRDHHFAIVHADLETGVEDCFRLPDGEFASEALFAPKGPGAAEGEGYILAIFYRAAGHASHLAVFDAQRVGEGPIARAHFDHHIPSSFHGTWVPSRSERVV
jgi:all-trans-8'-apo-beta-carotenal 15,15'-oxygenase